MVRNLSWPAVSHYYRNKPNIQTRIYSHDEYTYDLKLHSLAIELDCADFLNTSVTIRLQASPQQVPYEVHTDG